MRRVVVARAIDKDEDEDEEVEKEAEAIVRSLGPVDTAPSVLSRLLFSCPLPLSPRSLRKRDSAVTFSNKDDGDGCRGGTT